MASTPPVVLFGYDSSAFTQKIRQALKIKGVKYDFVLVPSMMPRPTLRKAFHLTYRKIPVLVIGREVYSDTSIIIEALEHFFPESKGYRTLYPAALDGRTHRPLMRGFASYWTDKPLFRVTTGLIPGSVWRTAFGRDRAGLIGHKLDPDKLEKKLPRNLAGLDLQLSLLEPQFQKSTSGTTPWLFSTPHPSVGDIALYYQLDWANDISAGRGLENLTAGGTNDTNTDGMTAVFNANRYPALYSWYTAMKRYLEALPDVELSKGTDVSAAADAVNKWTAGMANADEAPPLLPTPNPALVKLEAGAGLVVGAEVVVAPDDTGRDDPTFGTLLALSPEEVVIKARELQGEGKALVDVRLHFPRVGFVVVPRSARL